MVENCRDCKNICKWSSGFGTLRCPADATVMTRYCEDAAGEGHGKAVNGNESRICSYTLPSQGSSTPQPSSAAALTQTSFDSQSDSLSASIVHTVIPRSRSGSAQGMFT